MNNASTDGNWFGPQRSATDYPQGPVVAVVPARMGSSRLPGKMLRPLAGRPLLGRLLDRLSFCRRLDRVVVATSDQAGDDAVAAFCAAEGVACFRGSEDDVLGRLSGALSAQGAETGVLIFGDGPLADPAVVDDIVGRYLSEPGRWDFVGNDLTTTYPPGLEVEAFRATALADAEARCGDPAIREHGTLFIRRNPGLYRLLNVEAPPELRRPEIEIEVDTEEDFFVISAIFEHFADQPDVGAAEIIAFLDADPELKARNRDVVRRWKEFRSV